MKNNNCCNPCLPNCASDQRIIYLVIGFILGLISYILIDKFIIRDYDEINDE